MPEIAGLSAPDEESLRLGDEARGRLRPLSEWTGDLLPAQRPTLIGGTLRQGHKMLVAGPPKAGKTWLVIQLAYAVANGLEWLGRPCARGRVCMVDGEMDPASFYHRCDAVARAMWPGAPPEERRRKGEGISVLHLRGDLTTDAESLVVMLMEAYGDDPPALVTVDPIYKLLSGDENSNSDMRRFVKAMDELAAWGPSVCLTHHHAKGRAGERQVTDRAAGAGTFSRDPDAFIDLTPLDVREGSEHWRALEAAFPQADGEGRDEWQARLRSKSVLRANAVLREFPDTYGSEFAFDWPLMVPVAGMSDAPEEGSADAGRARANQARRDAADARWDVLDELVAEAVGECEEAGEVPTRRAVHGRLRAICEADGEVRCPPLATFRDATKAGGRSAWTASREAPYALSRREVG